MSCGCTSTATPSPSITCGSCGYQCTSCVCPPDPIVMPTVTCADPATCTEVYPLECIQYTGEDIKCSTSAATLYPNTTHIVATNGDMLPDILNNINSQLCYMFSTDFINQMLSNIQDNSELITIFCSIKDTCGTPPTTLICPTVSTLTYNVGDAQNYLEATFNYVPYATSYTYKFYVEITPSSNTYIAIIGGTLPQPSVALPITITAPLSGTSYTSTRKYLVLVQAVDGNTYTPGGPDFVSYNTITGDDYNILLGNYPNNCGNYTYTQTDTSQTCSLATIRGSFKAASLNINAVQFLFTQETSNPLYFPPSTYTVHWYLKNSLVFPAIYEYMNYETISYTSGQAVTVNLYKPSVTSTNLSKTSTTVTVTKTGHGLSSGMYIKIDNAITGIPAGEYIITVTTLNIFTITTTGNTTALPGVSPSINYKAQLRPTDQIVVMITTNVANNDSCYKGIIKRQGGQFSDAEITNFLSNSVNNVYKNYQ